MAIAVRPAVARGDARPALVGHHHDARYDLRYAPIGSGGGGGAEVTITGTEGVTVVESPANTFALGLTASPDASNTIEIRGNGIYAASGAIPPEYVTDAELATALAPYLTTTAGDTRYVNATGGDAMAGPLTVSSGGVAVTGASTFSVAPTVGGSALLTQTAGDARYTQGGLTQAAADLRYEPIDTMYTKAESDARYATPASVTSAVSTHAAAADPHTGYLLESLVDAKGDLLTATADNTPARLPAGTNGQFLTAQSGQATGLQWAADPVTAHVAAGDPHPQYATDTDLSNHAAAANPHSVYATDADLTAHAAAADPHTGYVLESVLTARGDLFAASAPSTPARLAVGADTQVLTADSSQASGMRWATPASGGMTNPMTTKGDLIAGGTAGAATRLGVGTNGQFLTAQSGQSNGLQWAADPVVAHVAAGDPHTGYLLETGGTLSGALTVSAGGIAVTGASTFSVAPTVGGSALLTQSAGDARYALASALTALTTRVTTLEGQVATLQSRMTGHTHLSGTIAAAGGVAVMP